MKKLLFTSKSAMETSKDKKIFNFLNLESLWHYKNNPMYPELISQERNINFPDGRLISLKLKIIQQRGPTFTKEFLSLKKIEEKKHFFIGSALADEIASTTGIAQKNLSVYNPTYIKDIQFSKKERDKIITILKKFEPNYIWVCVGAPKQEILSNQLFDKYASNYFNVGAALDFLLSKKQEAPSIAGRFGAEWFYRLITDFKHSKKKVWRSFMGLIYLGDIELK